MRSHGLSGSFFCPDGSLLEFDSHVLRLGAASRAPSLSLSISASTRVIASSSFGRIGKQPTNQPHSAAFSARQILRGDGSKEEEDRARAAFVRPPLHELVEPLPEGTAPPPTGADAMDLALLYPRAFSAARAGLQHFSALNPGFSGERRLTMLLALGAGPENP